MSEVNAPTSGCPYTSSLIKTCIKCVKKKPLNKFNPINDTISEITLKPDLTLWLASCLSHAIIYYQQGLKVIKKDKRLKIELERNITLSGTILYIVDKLYNNYQQDSGPSITLRDDGEIGEQQYQSQHYFKLPLNGEEMYRLYTILWDFRNGLLSRPREGSSIIRYYEGSSIIDSRLIDNKKMFIGESKRAGYILELLSRQIQNSRMDECQNCVI